MHMKMAKPIKLFYSYSHKDEALRKKLETHLSILKKRGIISGWHDRCITAGSAWAEAIDEHLNTADIILLLVSADFLASDYCYDKEMARAMERHQLHEARVIPIILRDCDWQFALFSKLQALPKDGKPVAAWSNRDEAFKGVAVSIRKIAEELASNAPKPLGAHRQVREAIPVTIPRASSYRSPLRDARDLLIFGPRFEIEMRSPIHNLSPAAEPSHALRMPALIDTGAERTVVSPAAIRQAGLPRVGSIRLAHIGGKEHEVGLYAAEFRFPRSKLTSIEVEITSVELAQPLIHCLLGRDVLSRWTFTYMGRSGSWVIEEPNGTDA